MKCCIICPALPPQLDGIGDYSALLAREMSAWAGVTLLAPREAAEPTPIPNVRIVQAFSAVQRRSVMEIEPLVQRERPDWLILQFNQFSYGRWGLNPFMPWLMRRIASSGGPTRLAVMFHEDFVPKTSWRFRVMRTWQRRQFLALGRSADLVVFSIDPWRKRYEPWFGGRPVLHIPVGSNIPDASISRCESRRRLGIPAGQFVVGLFGTVGGARMLGHVKAAVGRIASRNPDTALLYIGPHLAAVRDALGDAVPILGGGPFPADEVANRLAAVDLYLAPFVDGVSSRRGSFIAALQQGLPTVGAVGELTDDFLRRANGSAVLLADAGDIDAFARLAERASQDAAERSRLSASARALHQATFAWNQIGLAWRRAIEHRLVSRT